MDMPLTHYVTPEDGPFYVGGFEAAIKQLAAQGMIDPHRVGVIGFSYTCFHVLYALTHRPDLFVAASITDGLNMGYVQYIFSTDSESGFGQRAISQTNGGLPFGKGLMEWATRGPGFNLDRVEAPLLISALERGQLLAEWEIYSGLRVLGKPVDMVWLRHEDAPHVLVKPKQRYFSQQLAVDWFGFWLQDYEDPDPPKAVQYKRWRELRKKQAENDAKDKAAKEKPAALN
jgi:hypothetical protein